MFLKRREVFEVVNYEVLSYQLPASRVFSLTQYLQSYLTVYCLLITEYCLLNLATSFQLPEYFRSLTICHAISYQYLRKREGTPGFPCVRMSDAENRGWG